MALRTDFLKQDISAGFVVFLVALPLCLGIAIASEAPPIAGLIAGIIAGLLVSFLSGSELSVSGPAAGLTVTVIAAQKSIGSFEGLMVATALSGAFQILLSSLRAGLLATFFPSSVIKGMLAGIGIIIAVKQIPHAVGWINPFDAEEGLLCLGSPFCLRGFFQFLQEPHERISFGALGISLLSLYTLILWERLGKAKGGLFKILPGPLVVVVLGVVLNQLLFISVGPWLALTSQHSQLVSIPPINHLSDLIRGPSSWVVWLSKPEVWSAAAIIAAIGSVETLLSLEATDKLDPLRRVSRPNRELLAQGIGNMLSGSVGGLPITSVIVRSSTNVYAGGRTRLSGICHGALLLLSVLFIPTLLNMIPLASLAAILILVGYKLANVKVVKQSWAAGYDQFFPFVITVLGVIAFDLLTGVLVGTVLGLTVVLIRNHHLAFHMARDGSHYYLRFAKDVTFLQKIALKRTLSQLPNDTDIVIDGGGSTFIDHDIIELLEDFRRSARDRHISIELRRFPAIKFNLFTALKNKVNHG